MIVELRFLTGRFHATPWGRHVNEAEPEWPPSPFRLLRALVDVWYRKHPELPAEEVERLLSALSAPPRFRLPPARASHTRSYLSQNAEDPSDKKLVFDGFAVFDRRESVLIGWPDVILDAPTREIATTLFASLNYLGRSESWVEARMVDERAVEWNASPLTPGQVPPKKEVVSVAGVVSPERFATLSFEIPGKGKTKARRLGWFEALTWGSAEAIANTMNRPPALEPTFYVRDADALSARPAVVVRRTPRRIEAVRYSLDGRVKVPITEALRIAEEVHRNLMGALRNVLRHSDLGVHFTGRDADGEPAHDHPHISILPMDEDRDGYLDTVLITCPEALTSAEQRALDQLAPLRRWDAHPLTLTPMRYGSRAELLRSATVVESHTPYAPSRHWRLKRDGDELDWLRRQVGLDCARHGLATPIAIERIPPPANRRRARWLDFRRARLRRGEQDAPQPAYGIRMTFSEPISTPFSIGYASHFGLGCFWATR